MHRSWPISILLVSSDPDLQAQIKQTFKSASITMATDSLQAQKYLEKKPYEVMLVESKGREASGLQLSDAAEEQDTLVISGSRRTLRQALNLLHTLSDGKSTAKSLNGTALSLEDLIQSKVTDFVKGMRSGSARNLHPILIAAVERPLLSSTLHETQGNQIQAARLLGMNRNTLRKKLTALDIPLTRTKSAQKVVH